MNNISIADYLKLREIAEYLEDRRIILVSDNNGYTCAENEKLNKIIGNLDDILKKLESE